MNVEDDSSWDDEIARLAAIVNALKEHGRVADDPESVAELVERAGSERIRVTERHIEALVSLGVVDRVRRRRAVDATRRLVAGLHRSNRKIAIAIGAVALIAGAAIMLGGERGGREIAGTVFVDYDADGVRDSAGVAGGRTDAPVAGVAVVLRDRNESVVDRAVSGPTGDYELTPSRDGPFRLEFSDIPEDLFPTPRVGDDVGPVQFVERGARSDLALIRPLDYCQEGPPLATTCFISGDHSTITGDRAPGARDAVVSFPWEATDFEETFPPSDWPPATIVPAARWIGGTGPAPLHLASVSEVGAAWGIAHDRRHDRLFAAAMLKRHADLGALGTGGIYVIADPLGGGNEGREWLDVETLRYPPDMSGALAGARVRTGPDPRDGTQGNEELPPRVDRPSHDIAAFAAVGRRAFGDLDIDSTGQILWAVNLFDRTLLAINVADRRLRDAWPVPNPGCASDEDVRPWGLAVIESGVYLGVVCSAQESGQAEDLSAHVVRLAAGRFESILSIPLDYRRSAPASPPDGSRATPWAPWVGDVDFADDPQPVLSDIEFDAAGMTIALLDRQGHQWGHANYAPDLGDMTPDESRATAGELLRACLVRGQWTLEQNGRCGSLGAAPQDTGRGPPGPFTRTRGSAEYFFAEEFVSPFVRHEETGLGSVAALAGSDTVASTVLDPVGLFSSGTAWFNAQTGDHTHRYEVLVSEDVDAEEQNGTFGKATGLGDLEVLCHPAPLTVGGRLWRDHNADGRQGASEEPLGPGLEVLLRRPGGPTVARVSVDEDGYYAFRWDHTAAPPASLPGTYEIAIDVDQESLKGLTPTLAAAGSTADPHGNRVGAFVRLPIGRVDFGRSVVDLSVGWAPDTR